MGNLVTAERNLHYKSTERTSNGLVLEYWPVLEPLSLKVMIYYLLSDYLISMVSNILAFLYRKIH